MADLPDRWSLRQKLGRRMFGGASGGVSRGMAILALGSGIGRVIGVAAIPVLTRLFTPEDFGVMAVFTALVAILAPLVTMRYALALPLPRHDGVAINLFALSTGLMLVLSALVALALWLGGGALLGLVSMQILAPWWWLIALGVLGTASYEMLTLWATRRRAYKVIAQTSVTQSVAGAMVKIALGLLSFQPLGLLVGQVVAQAGGIVRLLREFMPDFRANWHHISGIRLRKAAWKHRGFPIWRVPSQFLMVFSMQAPMLFMAAIYDTQTTGQFGLAMMALSLPVTVLGQSAGKALYGEAAQVFRKEPARIAKMAREVQFRLLAVSLLPAATLFFFGAELFKFAFGPEWAVAGQFTSIISLAIVFQFASAPLIQLMNLLKNQSVFLLVNIVRSVGLTLIFLVGGWMELGAMTVVGLYSIFTTLFYLAVSIFILSEFNRIQPRGVNL